jgi:hypothetical protein
VNEALQGIFEKLQTRALDEGLTSQHSNLFDFVDNQSVQKLQRQAVQEIREMEVRSLRLLYMRIHVLALTNAVFLSRSLIGLMLCGGVRVRRAYRNCTRM